MVVTELEVASLLELDDGASELLGIITSALLMEELLMSADDELGVSACELSLVAIALLVSSLDTELLESSSLSLPKQPVRARANKKTAILFHRFIVVSQRVVYANEEAGF